MSAGVEAQPRGDREAARRLGRGPDAPARPDSRRTWSARSPSSAGRAPSSSPARRWSSTAVRRSIESCQSSSRTIRMGSRPGPATTSSTTSSATRRTSAPRASTDARSSGASPSGPRASGSCAATASTSRPAASPTCHTHPGPGLRVLLKGRIRIDTQGTSHEYGPFEWWYETGPDPVYAAASDTEDTAFVRVMVLPGRLEGQADDLLRRPRRRREAEAPARAHLPRAAACEHDAAAASCSSTSSSSTGRSSCSACPARATSTSSTAFTTHPCV